MTFSNNGLFGTFDGTLVDPVHGTISFYEHEKFIIDHLLFQRLRFINQTDVLNLVFPGSIHNRFQHSLGTMHMAGVIFRKLIESYLSEDREYGQSAKLNQTQIESIQYLHWLVRIAALLHDVGHFPFSHQFEFYLERNDKLKLRIANIWQNMDTDAEKIYGKTTYHKFSNTDSKNHIKHEDLSLRIAYEILMDNRKQHPVKSLDNIFDVLMIMEKKTEDDFNFEFLWNDREQTKNICYYIIHFHSIFLGDAWEQKCDKDVTKKVIQNTIKLFKNIISSEVDADKMDYILRDSFYIGCNYGHFNKEHLLNTLRIGYEAIKDKTNLRYKDIQYHISILDKGLGALEDFIYSRFQLYQEIYNHKTVSGFRILLHESFKEIFSDGNVLDETKSSISNINNYYYFNDSYIWGLIARYGLANPNSYSYALISRQNLKYISTIINKSPRQIEIYKNKLSQASGKNYQHWKSDIKFSRIDGYYDTIKVWKRELGSKKKSRLDSIEESTDFFKKFEHKSIIHIFEI